MGNRTFEGLALRETTSLPKRAGAVALGAVIGSLGAWGMSAALGLTRWPDPFFFGFPVFVLVGAAIGSLIVALISRVRGRQKAAAAKLR